MLPLERKQQIIKYLGERQTASVAELGRYFRVSEMTIRRDLKELEREGYVRRTFGGAMLIKPLKQEIAYDLKKDVRLEQKNRLAQYAVRHFVRHDDVIFLEGGTTVLQMAKHLHTFRGLTIATNGMNTMAHLQKAAEENTVLCCGGILRPVSMTLVGPQAEQFFRQIHAHTAFLSAQGLTAEQGFTDPNPLEIEIKRAMASNAQQVVMLLDSEKWGKCSTLTGLALSEVDVVITDRDVPAEMAEILREHNVEVHIADG